MREHYLKISSSKSSYSWNLKLKSLLLVIFLATVPHQGALASTTATEAQTSHKKRIRDASNLSEFIPSRCPMLANFSVVEFWMTVSKFRKRKIKAMFTLVQIAFAPTRKLYRTGPRFTHKSGDFGAISVTERSCAAPHWSVEGHISDRYSH